MKTDLWTRMNVAGACGLLALTAALGVGCRGDRSDKPPRAFFPDMDNSPRWKPQSETPFFADGRTMRQPVPGTVAFGRWADVPASVDDASWTKTFREEREDLLKEDDAFYRGEGPDGSYLDFMPVRVTRAMVERGRERFNIYCFTCHGYEGDGKGMVGRRWAYPLPDFHDPKYTDRAQRTGKDGYIFHVIRNGVVINGEQKMPSYAHAIGERDAWAIVAYVRALQESRAVPIDDPIIPEAQRQRLLRTRNQPRAAGGGTP